MRPTARKLTISDCLPQVGGIGNQTIRFTEHLAEDFADILLITCQSSITTEFYVSLAVMKTYHNRGMFITLA